MRDVMVFDSTSRSFWLALIIACFCSWFPQVLKFACCYLLVYRCVLHYLKSYILSIVYKVYASTIAPSIVCKIILCFCAGIPMWFEPGLPIYYNVSRAFTLSTWKGRLDILFDKNSGGRLRSIFLKNANLKTYNNYTARYMTV